MVQQYLCDRRAAPWYGVILMLCIMLTATSSAADLGVTAKIEETEAGEITRFDFDRFLFVSNSTPIEIEVRNIGSTQIQSNFTVEVYDEDTRLYRYFVGPDFIDPGGIRKERLVHTANTNGTYVLRLTARLGERRYRIARTMQVFNVPDPQPSNTTIVQRNVEFIEPPGQSESSEVLTRDWNVTYPHIVNLTQGSTRTVPVTIQNTGEDEVQNIEFSLDTPSALNVSYSPLFMFTIPPGSNRSFLLTVEARNSTFRDQEIEFTVSSNRLRARGVIDIPIYPTQTIQRMEEELDSLILLVSDLKGAIKAPRDGVNGSSVNSSIREAYSSINRSRQALKRQDIVAAKSALEEARTHINTGYTTFYTDQGQERLGTGTIPPQIPLVILALLVGGIMIGLYRHYSQEARKRPKLLREEEA